MKTMKKNMNRVGHVVAIALLILGAVSVRAQTTSALEEARAALRANDLNKASELLEPLTGEGARDAAAYHLLSNVRIAQKNTKDAAVLAEKATTLDPTKAAYFSQLGVALGMRMSEVGFMEQAMMAGKLKQAFARAVELDPNDITGLIGLARFYMEAPPIAGGSFEKAKELAGRLQRLHPFLGAVELGGIAEREENFAEALKYFETAAELQPDDAGLQFQCGRMLAKFGRKGEARARFEAALKINPSFEAATKSLAELDAPAE
jgi:tetratricopeptide (TPR) repeat protein